MTDATVFDRALADMYTVQFRNGFTFRAVAAPTGGVRIDSRSPEGSVTLGVVGRGVCEFAAALVRADERDDEMGG